MPVKRPEIIVSDRLNTSSVVALIQALQRPSGDIPWHVDGKTDPWDLVESIMGLQIGGCFTEAKNALKWLKDNQNKDGSWYSAYVDGSPSDRTCETHMAAYIAVGLFHNWLITKDADNLKAYWPVMTRAVEYALSLQTEKGNIFWAKSPQGKTDPMSLLAGSSSIFMSLKCALCIAKILKKRKPAWEKAVELLGISLKEHSHHYNMTKSRFSMYWFYPVLSGALTGKRAESRIQKQWHKYVLEGQGVKCVSDQPWVTIAETCELVLTLNAMGEHRKAKIVFSWILDRVYDDKTFWCGYTYPDMVIWPEEKISWTNAVVLMAADALYKLTPASDLFKHDAWEGFLYKGL